MLVELCQSKTDPFRRGQSVHIFSTNSSTCPVRAFKLFAGLVGTRPSHSLVFSMGTFSPLTRSKLTATIHCLLSQTRRCPHNYSSHSFRIGAATTAAAAGLPTWLIKTLGRWSSNAYLSYVRCPIDVIASVPKLCHQHWSWTNPPGTLTVDYYINTCIKYTCTYLFVAHVDIVICNGSNNRYKYNYCI